MQIIEETKENWSSLTMNTNKSILLIQQIGTSKNKQPHVRNTKTQQAKEPLRLESVSNERPPFYFHAYRL